jgi:hypothetical protein
MEMVLCIDANCLSVGRRFYLDTLGIFRESPRMLAEPTSNAILRFIGDPSTEDPFTPQQFALHLNLMETLANNQNNARFTLPVNDPMPIYRRIQNSDEFRHLAIAYTDEPYFVGFTTNDPFGNHLTIEWYTPDASSGYWAES